MRYHKIAIALSFGLVSSSCSGLGSEDSDQPLTLDAIYDQARGRLAATASRPIAPDETVHLSARRGRLGTIDCSRVATAVAPADVDGDTILGPAVDEALLRPFYGPEWGYEPTAEMIAAVANGTDSIIDVCVVRGEEIVAEQEIDLFRAWDRARSRGIGGKADSTSGETRINSVEEYGERCVAELGEIPFFEKLGDGDYTTYDCLESTPIPMTVTKEDGTVEHPETTVSVCDQPQYIYSLCEAGPRVASRVNEDGTRWVLLCRKSVGGWSSSEFNDIAMIGHNPFTGKTCFFQNALYERRDGANVPHPADKIKSKNLWQGVQGGLGSSIECARCHDADPFIHTPWIDGAKDAQGRPIVPKMGVDEDFDLGYNDAPYSLVNAQGQGWTMPKQIVSPEAAPCLRCHRMGNGRWVQWASRLEGTDTAWSRITTPEFLKAHNLYWMPPNLDGATAENWSTSELGRALDFIQTCSPSSSSCRFEPIPTGAESSGGSGGGAVDLPDDQLALKSLQLLGADIPGATPRCNECHAITRSTLKQWREETNEALQTCLPDSLFQRPPPSIDEQATILKDQLRSFGPFDVAEGASIVATINGDGDVDLALNQGSAPTFTQADTCRPATISSNEECRANTAGRYFVAVRGSADTSTIDLHIAVEKPSSTQTKEDNFGPLDVEAQALLQVGVVDVPAGGTFEVEMSGDGDADLYVKRNQTPSTDGYDCRPYKGTSDERCGAGSASFDATGPARFYFAVRGFRASRVEVKVRYTAAAASGPSAKDLVACMRVDPSSPDSAFKPDKIGIYAAAAHLDLFKDLFRSAYPPGVDGNGPNRWAVEYAKFKRRSAMPKGNNPKLTQDELDIVAEWFRRGLPKLEETLPRENPPTSCAPLITTELVDHASVMKTEGWTATNAERGINMLGCAPGQAAVDCLADFPRASDKSYGATWDVNGSTIRILRELDFSTSFWTRSSADGRFVGSGGGPRGGPGSFVVDLLRGTHIGVHANYDPGFFPDNSGFLFQGTDIGAGFCSQSLLADGPAEIHFNEPGCTSASGVSLYQHLGAGLNGADYFVINSQNTADNGGREVRLKDPSASFSSNATMRFTAMIQGGNGFEVTKGGTYEAPYEGDSVLSPSTLLVASRLSGGDEQLGYVIRKIDARKTPSGYLIRAPIVGRFCDKGAKPVFSFDERFLAIHHYIGRDDYADLGFSSPDDPGFQPYLTRGAANIYIVDLTTGQKSRATNMGPGQYALFPHFRSDGWLYFIVREAGASHEWVATTDAVLRAVE